MYRRLLKMVYSDSTSGIRGYSSWCESTNRSNHAIQSNFKITKGVIEGLVGMESPEHIGMVYTVRLIDTPGYVTIRCRRMVDSASYDGVGEYSPLEQGDPVIVTYKEGMVQDGLILGSIYTEGHLKDFYVRGKANDPKSPQNSNQPSIHPNRIAQPDAWFHIVGGKVHPYRDPALTDDSLTQRASKRPFPASIQLKNKMGDVAQYARGDIIFYSDSNIILFSSQEGISKCKRLQELSIYYQEMLEELERFVGTGNVDEDISNEVISNKSDSLRSLINGDGIDEIKKNLLDIDFSRINKVNDVSQEKNQKISGVDNRNNIEVDDDRRNKRNINNQLNVDYMMWAPMVSYHIPQLKALIQKCKELYINCKEESSITTSELNTMVKASTISKDECAFIEEIDEINDEFIEKMAEGSICRKDGVTHYPFNKWKLDKNEAVTLGEYASTEIVKDALIHKKTLDAFTKMRDKAKEESNGEIVLGISSAYRDEEYLKEKGLEVRECSSNIDLKSIAPVNNSEHLTGYCIDVVDINDANTFSLHGDYDSKAWKWIDNNCNKYGFEISFPKGNNQGLNYEPWHLRYIDDIPQELALLFSYSKKGKLEKDTLTQDKKCNTSPKQESIEHTQDEKKEDEREYIDLDRLVKANNIEALGVIIQEDILTSTRGKDALNVASGIKLIIAEVIAKKITNKELTLDTPIKVKSHLIAEDDYEYKEDSVHIIRDLLINMLEKSGNTSTNMLVDLVGGAGQGVNKEIKDLGYKATTFDRYLSLPSNKGISPNKSSVFEMAVSLYRLVMKGEGDVGNVTKKALAKAEKPKGLNKEVIYNKMGYTSLENFHVGIYSNKQGYFVISAINNKKDSIDYDLTAIKNTFNSLISTIDDLEIKGLDL